MEDGEETNNSRSVNSEYVWAVTNSGVDIPSLYDELSRYLLKRIGDKDTAEDLVQETFLYAVERAHQLRTPESFRAWMYTICKRRLISHWRMTAKKFHSEDQWRLGQNTDFELDSLAEIEEHEQLSDLLQKLPNNYRTIIWLNCFAGFTAREMAPLLELSFSATEKRLSRAKACLRIELLKSNPVG